MGHLVLSTVGQTGLCLHCLRLMDGNAAQTMDTFQWSFFGSDLSYRHVCDLYLSFLLEPKHFLQLLMPLTLKVTLRTLSLRNFQEHRLFISF